MYLFWCPGCECAHHLETSRWQWNGDMVKPTANPSLLLKPQHVTGGVRCHFFITAGKIRFLGDCTHKFKGKTVDMVPWDQAGER